MQNYSSTYAKLAMFGFAAWGASTGGGGVVAGVTMGAVVWCIAFTSIEMLQARLSCALFAHSEIVLLVTSQGLRMKGRLFCLLAPRMLPAEASAIPAHPRTSPANGQEHWFSHVSSEALPLHTILPADETPSWRILDQFSSSSLHESQACRELFQASDPQDNAGRPQACLEFQGSPVISS